MAQIAFYAPMKPPTHPTPSGDREMARGLVQLLKENTYGHEPVLASELRIYDAKGDIDVQNTLIECAEREAAKLIKQATDNNWSAWFTYHNYYKAPDLIGPIVSKALGIPYILCEATRAKKRLTGPWAQFAQYAEAASDQADMIFYFTQQDKVALEKYQTSTQNICYLPPFLLKDEISLTPRIKPKKNSLLSVGMMRKGAKTQSYAVIAEILNHIETNDWHLNIIGDGPNAPEIKSLFQNVKDNVSFLGKQDKATLENYYTEAAAFLWPGVDEAYGMVYLEAQAAGLPIIAQDRPGVCDVITSDTHLHATDNPKAMAKAIDLLFTSDTKWQEQSQASLNHISNNHLKPKASETLWSHLKPLIAC